MSLVKKRPNVLRMQSPQIKHGLHFFVVRLMDLPAARGVSTPLPSVPTPPPLVGSDLLPVDELEGGVRAPK